MSILNSYYTTVTTTWLNTSSGSVTTTLAFSAIQYGPNRRIEVDIIDLGTLTPATVAGGFTMISNVPQWLYLSENIEPVASNSAGPFLFPSYSANTTTGSLIISCNSYGSNGTVSITNPIANNLAVMTGTSTGLKSADTTAVLQQPLSLTTSSNPSLSITSSNTQPYQSIGTTSTTSNRGATRYGRNAVFEIGSDSTLGNKDDFYIWRTGARSLVVENPNYDVYTPRGARSNTFSILSQSSNTAPSSLASTSLWANSSNSNRAMFGTNQLAYISDLPASWVGFPASLVAQTPPVTWAYNPANCFISIRANGPFLVLSTFIRFTASTAISPDGAFVTISSASLSSFMSNNMLQTGTVIRAGADATTTAYAQLINIGSNLITLAFRTIDNTETTTAVDVGIFAIDAPITITFVLP